MSLRIPGQSGFEAPQGFALYQAVAVSRRSDSGLLSSEYSAGSKAYKSRSIPKLEGGFLGRESDARSQRGMGDVEDGCQEVAR
jgi:hypothetical protein